MEAIYAVTYLEHGYTMFEVYLTIFLLTPLV